MLEKSIKIEENIKGALFKMKITMKMHEYEYLNDFKVRYDDLRKSIKNCTIQEWNSDKCKECDNNIPSCTKCYEDDKCTMRVDLAKVKELLFAHAAHSDDYLNRFNEDTVEWILE